MQARNGQFVMAGLILLIFISVGPAAAQSDETGRIEMATTVFEEVMSAPDRAIPRALLGRAEAIAVFPSTIKAGFIFGGHRGRGIISARDADSSRWSAPAFLTLTGGSFGLQIGAQAVDLVLVIMNRRGLEKLLQDQFQIGGDASAVVGPLGRDVEASTDILLQAEILSYSRTRGLFAGVTLKGSTIRADRDANERFYGRPYRTQKIVLEGQEGTAAAPEAVARWREAVAAVAKDSP